MRCQYCGRQLCGLCLNCEDHLFDAQVGLTIGRSSITTLLEEKQKLSEKCKELRASVINLRVGIIISVSIGLALGVYVAHLKFVIESLRNIPKPPIAQLDEDCAN